jgi:hypothetical protein
LGKTPHHGGSIFTLQAMEVHGKSQKLNASRNNVKCILAKKNISLNPEKDI